ncbi:MAG: ABC transporter substrate-binding protein [Thermodesulfobacteriota bacterium]
MVRTRLTLMAVLLALLGFALLSLFPSDLPAAEKLKYGSSVKSPTFYLPILAAEEKGIWKQNGLNVEWVPFKSGGAHYRAFAAGATKIGASMTAADIRSAARGVPVVIVSNLQVKDEFALWVLTKSRFNKPGDLKGAKIGVSRYGGTEHSYGQVVIKQLGLIEDVKFVSTGGTRESVAVLTTGKIDGVVLSPRQLIRLKLQGRIKELLYVRHYLPQPWGSHVVVAHKDLIRAEPNTVKAVVRSILQANRFVESKQGEPWALAKMMEMNRYSDKEAKIIYDGMEFSLDGKLKRKAVENVRAFLIEYGLVKANETPPVDELFTVRFIP